MTELELIESYFAGELSQDEKRIFEKRLEDDQSFAKEVGLYILSRQAAQEALLEEKKQKFLEHFEELSANSPQSTTGIRIHWWHYGAAAAASLLILILFVTYFNSESPERLAESYIDRNLATLSTTMSGATDSLALGVAAFNRKDYPMAQSIFRSLEDNNDVAIEATEYLGITYLRTRNYDKAAEQFKKLITFDELYSNPGKFYLALTLMRRSSDGDRDEAKKLLEQVVNQRLPGHLEASQWLKDF